MNQVSQIVPTGSASPPSRWTYGYELVGNGEGYEEVNYLHTISVPSPTGNSTSTSTIWYSNDPTSGNPNYGNPSPGLPFVSALVDGNGNQRLYTSVNSSGAVSYPSTYTRVTVKNAGGDAYTYTAGYDGTTMNETTRTDGAGHALSSTVYDTLKTSLPSSITDGNDKTTNYTWDSYGNMLTMTPPSSGVRTPAVTTNTYSYANFALGEMTQTVAGAKSPTAYAYFEPSGLTKTITAPLPGTVGSASTAVTSFTYDTLGNPLTVIRPGNNTSSAITTTLNYTADGSYSQADAIGQPLTVTDSLSKVTHLRYDAQGNAVGVKDALGNEMDQTYTIANLPLQTVLPATGQSGSGHAGSLNTYLYAEPSSLATAQWPAATLQYGPAATTTSYDEGNVGAIRQVVNTYGPEGELLTVSGSAEPVSYTYDALYRLKTLKDAALNTTSYFYNTAGYLAQVVYPGAQATPPIAPLTAGTKDTVTLPSYDGAGNRLSRTDGNNVTTTYAYTDPESRLTDITYPAGTIGPVHYAYDAYGRRSAMTDGTGGQTYAYDDDDALTQKNVTWTGFPAKTISYGFYPDGSRSSMNADGRAFSYGYDGVGRMNTLTNDNSETTTYSYQDNGWLFSKRLANGVGTEFIRDYQGRINSLRNMGTNKTFLSIFSVPRTGGYDGVGNRLSVTASMPGAPASYSGTTSYAYDYGQTQSPQMNRSQLTQETSTRNGSYTNVFGYDGGTSGGPGNPTSFKGTTSAFNADNQVTNTGYGYDGNGNPTTYRSLAYTFDPENRLASVGTARSGSTNAYDADGHLVMSSNIARGALDSQELYRLYDGEQPVGFYPTASNAKPTAQPPATTDTYGPDGLVSACSTATSASTFYTFDERGNVAQRLSKTAAVLSSDVYDAYGTQTTTATTADSVGFGGQFGYYTDSNFGLILCTHRYYDPATGRFINRDHITYGGGINIYGYTKNNPTNWIDPSGYSPVIKGPSGGFGGGIPLPICDAIDLVLCAQLCFGRQMGGGTCVIVVGGSAPGLYCLCVEIKIIFDACTGAETQIPVYTYVYTPSNIHT